MEGPSHPPYSNWRTLLLGLFQRPLTLILRQEYRDTSGSRIVIQIGGAYTTLRAKGTLISEPRFSPPCEMRFFPREKGKNRISQGGEHRGSLNSVPLALRVLSAQRRAYFCKSIAIEMGGVSRYFFGEKLRGNRPERF